MTTCSTSGELSLPTTEFTGVGHIDDAPQVPVGLAVFTEQERTYDTRTLRADEPTLVVIYLGLTSNTDSGTWLSVGLPAAGLPMAEEHFLVDAYKQLQDTIDDKLFYLLPEKFTLTQAHGIYDSITGYLLKPPHFRRRIADKVKETDEFRQSAGHRPANCIQRGNKYESNRETTRSAP